MGKQETKILGKFRTYSDFEYFNKFQHPLDTNISTEKQKKTYIICHQKLIANG